MQKQQKLGKGGRGWGAGWGAVGEHSMAAVRCRLAKPAAKVVLQHHAQWQRWRRWQSRLALVNGTCTCTVTWQPSAAGTTSQRASTLQGGGGQAALRACVNARRSRAAGAGPRSQQSNDNTHRQHGGLISQSRRTQPIAQVLPFTCGALSDGTSVQGPSPEQPT